MDIREQFRSALKPKYGLCAVFVSAAMLQFGFMLGSRYEYAFSSALFWDDCIYVPQAFFDLNPMGPANPLFFYIFNVVSQSDSVAFLRVFFILIYSLGAGALAAITYRAIGQRGISILAGVAALSLPVFWDQGLFITGSHPTVGMAFTAVGLWLWFEANFCTSRQGLICLMAAAVMFAAAKLSSPVFFLAPIVLVIGAGLAVAFFRKYQFAAISAGFGFLSYLISIFFMPKSHHYEGVGWVNYSLSQILTNLLRAIQEIVSSLWSQDFLVANGLLIGSAILFLGVILRGLVLVSLNRFAFSKTSSPEWAAVFLILIASSALAFGPVSITATLYPRYLLGPAPIFFLAIVLVAYFLGAHSSHQALNRYLISAALALFIAANFLVTTFVVDRAMTPIEKLYQKLAGLIAEEGSRWAPNQEVLIFSPLGMRTTGGFNHWSTWYLRFLTGNPDIIGLIGPNQPMSQSPFVNQYQDHSPEYWTRAPQKISRIGMIGLEWGRPLSIYNFSANSDQARPINYIGVANLNGLDWYRTSHTTPLRDTLGKGNLGCEIPLEKVLIVPDENSKLPRINSRKLNGTGIKPLKLSGVNYFTIAASPSVNSRYNLSMVLRSSQALDSVSYSDASPPMPILASGLALYQTPEGFTVATQEGVAAQYKRISTRDQTIRIQIIGVTGCIGAIFANGHFVGALPSNLFEKPFFIGKGFKNRFWSGELLEFSLSFFDGNSTSDLDVTKLITGPINPQSSTVFE